MTTKKKSNSDNTINAGSMADVAFLLLIFFLVVTTIDIDKGILVKLPPWCEGEHCTISLPSKNVFHVNVNAQNALLAQGEAIGIRQLKDKTKAFILNPESRADYPNSPKKAIISLRNDRNTSYSTYLTVYNELTAAYRELRNDKAFEQYGLAFQDLSTDQKKLIRQEIPMVISEAEPTDFGTSAN